MGYIINEDGEKIKVDADNRWCNENVVLITDETILAEKYILEFYKKDICNKNSKESDFIGEKIFDTKPTQEQIIYELSQHRIGRYNGYAVCNKIYMLDFKEED